MVVPILRFQVIYKRYSHFDEFHQKLVAAYPHAVSGGGVAGAAAGAAGNPGGAPAFNPNNPTNANPTSATALPNADTTLNGFTFDASLVRSFPPLPPKRLTRSLAVEFVEKRKNELQDYLRAILDTPYLMHSPIVLKFLEVPDSVKPMLIAAASHAYRNTAGETIEVAGGASGTGGAAKNPIQNSLLSNSSHKSYEERRILELIASLKFHPNKVAAIKSFEDYFFDQRPRLTSELIRLLFQGKSGSDGDGGLIQTSGDLLYSHVAARASLYLLVRLLDVEKNKDAQLFLDQFGHIDHNVLKKMKLEQHIISERGNRLGAFRILSILKSISAAQQASGGGGRGGPHEFTVESIVNDSWAVAEYHRWADRFSASMNNTNGETANDHSSMNSAMLQSMAALNSNANSFKEMAAKCAEEVMQIYRDKDGFRPVRLCLDLTNGNSNGIMNSNQAANTTNGTNNSSGAFSPSGSSSSSSSLGNTLTVNSPSSTSGPSSPSASTVDINNEVLLEYKKVKDTFIVKQTVLLPYKTSDIGMVMNDTNRRKEWDLKFHTGRLLQLLDVNTSSDIVHMTFKSFSSPYKYRDMILLRSSSNIERSGQLHSFRSTIHADAPETKDSVRASLYPSGHVLMPVIGQISDCYDTSRSQVIGSSQEACLVTSIWSMDKEAILIVSPDLLGESNELKQSLLNVKNMLNKECGYRTLRASHHTQSISAQIKMGADSYHADGMAGSTGVPHGSIGGGGGGGLGSGAGGPNSGGSGGGIPASGQAGSGMSGNFGASGGGGTMGSGQWGSSMRGARLPPPVPKGGK